MSTTATESELERTVRQEQEQHDAAEGQDAEKGKLFEVPRVAVTIDEADPGVLKLAFSGSIELDRSKPDDVAFYNSLIAGRDAALAISAFVAGPKNSHRRDPEGNVDAVVQTKSLIVHSCEAD
jgi:hypothetical protein